MRIFLVSISLILTLMFTNGTSSDVQAQTNTQATLQIGKKQTPPYETQPTPNPYTPHYYGPPGYRPPLYTSPPYYNPPTYYTPWPPAYYTPPQNIPPGYYLPPSYQFPRYNRPPQNIPPGYYVPSPYYPRPPVYRPPVYRPPSYRPPVTRPPVSRPPIEWPPFPREPQGEVCGGMMGSSCSNPSNYCHMDISAQCGAADQTGVCRPRPQMCTEEYAPVCGCDGRTYSTQCKANGSGVSAAYSGQCR